ncbi:MAG TPA: PHP domain-containing protein [Elusimicrobiota bacterium]|nr:PHP domain-containing protein [Elusimicrobiota bacterium]
MRNLALLGLLAAYSVARAQSGGSPEALRASGERAFGLSALLGMEDAKNQPAPPPAGPPVGAAQQQSLIDFHTHSYCSDGIKSPEDMAKEAKAAGVLYWALTDHDTTACLSRAQKAAAAEGIHFVPGIELSAEDDSVHVLGLGIDPGFSGWKAYVDRARTERVSRSKAILAKLATLTDPATSAPIQLDFKKDILISRINVERAAEGKPPLTDVEAQSLSEKDALAMIRGQITRPDIARALVDNKFVKNSREAFDKYLGDDAPAGLPMDGISYQDAVELIHKAGGKAFLAHPYTIFKFKKFPRKYGGTQYADFNGLAKSIIDSGIDGFETLRPGSEKFPEDAKTVDDAIQKSGSQQPMLMGIGSDYHGYTQEKGGIGPRAIGGIAVSQQQAQGLLRGLNP